MKEKLKKLIGLCRTREGRRELFTKHREIIMYLIFGVLTTIISVVSFAVFRRVFPNEKSVPGELSWIFRITKPLGVESSTVLPNILSWIFASTFAFITNRIFVFRSRKRRFWAVLAQAAKFYASRVFTLLADVMIVFLLVDLTQIKNGLYELAAKLFSNVVVIVLNYIFSKLFVFGKAEKTEETPPENADDE